MKRIETNYDVHGIVRFKIIEEIGGFANLFRRINTQYKDHRTEEKHPLDFVVRIGDFVPDKGGCYVLDDRYYIKHDYFYCKDKRKLARWGLEISGFESGNMLARVRTNAFGHFSALIAIIDFLINYKINEKGFPLVHASCVSKEGSAFMFAARSGGGKTTLALNLMENGFDILSDNFVVLGGGSVLSFPSPLNIFTYNLNSVIRKNFGAKRRIFFFLRRMLFGITFGYIKMFTKVSIIELFPNQGIDKSALTAIFLLIPKQTLHIEQITKQDLIKHLVYNMKLDCIAENKYLLAYQYMFPGSNFSRHWDNYGNHLEKNISGNIPMYKIEVPQTYDEHTFGAILELVDSLR